MTSMTTTSYGVLSTAAMPSLPSWTTSTASPDSPRPRWMLAARRRSSSINKILMTSSIRTAPKRYLKGVLGWLQLRCPDLGPGPAERAKNSRRCPFEDAEDDWVAGTPGSAGGRGHYRERGLREGAGAPSSGNGADCRADSRARRSARRHRDD